MTIQEKISELAKIAEEIKIFKGLDIAKNCIKPVPGEGNPNADLFFIGEAPGAQEDATGHPFVGLSGKFLVKTLTETTGLSREDVFITSVVKYRPPDNRDPFPNEIAACRDWLDRQIAVVSPKIIVTLGRFSMANYFQGVTISKIHGQPETINLKLDIGNLKLVVFPSFHPAAALRGTTMLNIFKSDFLKLNDLLRQSLS